MTLNELRVQLTQELKSLSSKLVEQDYINACNQASVETGWDFPTGTSFKTHWMKERAKRHLFFYLLSESAAKFKVNGINLQHKFEHFKYLIKIMDEDFIAIQEDRPDVFSGVDSFKMFGTKIDAGFSSDSVGRDTTYSDYNEVVFTPTEND